MDRSTSKYQIIYKACLRCIPTRLQAKGILCLAARLIKIESEALLLQHILWIPVIKYSSYQRYGMRQFGPFQTQQTYALMHPSQYTSYRS